MRPEKIGGHCPRMPSVATDLVRRTKVRFNKNGVYCIITSIHLFGWIDVTTHLSPPLGSPLQSFLYSTLRKVHHSSILVINMDVVRGHINYAQTPPNEKDTL